MQEPTGYPRTFAGTVVKVAFPQNANSRTLVERPVNKGCLDPIAEISQSKLMFEFSRSHEN
jgi:hypothetical protein